MAMAMLMPKISLLIPIIIIGVVIKALLAGIIFFVVKLCV